MHACMDSPVLHSICMSVCLSFFLSVCLSLCMYVCRQYVCMYVCNTNTAQTATLYAWARKDRRRDANGYHEAKELPYLKEHCGLMKWPFQAPYQNEPPKRRRHEVFHRLVAGSEDPALAPAAKRCKR